MVTSPAYEYAMAIYELDGHVPDIARSAYISDDATVIGRVTIGEHASVWPGAVIRADDETIVIGAGSNIQDGAVLHVDPGIPMLIGSNVTVGHLAMLHGCTIGDLALIGLGSIIYNRAVIGRECLVGAGAIVTEGKSFADRSLVIGAPAQFKRELDETAIAGLRRAAETYIRRGAHYRAKLRRIG